MEIVAASRIAVLVLIDFKGTERKGEKGPPRRQERPLRRVSLPPSIILAGLIVDNPQRGCLSKH